MAKGYLKIFRQPSYRPPMLKSAIFSHPNPEAIP